MTKLDWGVGANRAYESGVSHGVFYPDSGPGVAWNGLISVTQIPDGTVITPFYYDGTKFRNQTTVPDFKATLTALSAPDEFWEYVGFVPVVPGFVLTKQVPRPFGFSYRTRMNGEQGYRIHIVYSALAIPTDKAANTLADTPSPSAYSWEINTLPVSVDGGVYNGTYLPNAHYFVDSLKIEPYILQRLEDLLYGTDATPPQLPPSGGL